jgi:hypothetical protein
MVVGFYHQYVGRVPFPVQGPWPSHQEPAAYVDPEVVAMVTCGAAHEMHGLDREEDAYEIEGSEFQALWHIGPAHRTWALN